MMSLANVVSTKGINYQRDKKKAKGNNNNGSDEPKCMKCNPIGILLREILLEAVWHVDDEFLPWVGRTLARDIIPIGSFCDRKV